MTINMNEIKKGSVLHLRCGGKLTVEEIRDNFITVDNNQIVVWGSGGKYVSDNYEYPFDIIKIDPPEFDWKDVEWGMAFYSIVRGLHYIYIGNSPKRNSEVIVQETTLEHIFAVPKQNLTRAPEHDIKVKK